MKGLIKVVTTAVFVAALSLAIGQEPPPSSSLEGTESPKLSSLRHIGGPFGLNRGMTVEQILNLVGRDSVVGHEQDPLGGTTLYLSRVPKGYDEFESYVVDISPTDGLLMIMAIGKVIEASSDGAQLRGHFHSLVDQLQVRYGNPSDSNDFLKASSSWSDDARYWMISLKEKERVLSAYWTKDLPSRLSAIALQTKALTITTGIVILSYEFDGLDKYRAEVEAKKGSNL